jgi:hypothetical protein
LTMAAGRRTGTGNGGWQEEPQDLVILSLVALFLFLGMLSSFRWYGGERVLYPSGVLGSVADVAVHVMWVVMALVLARLCASLASGLVAALAVRGVALARRRPRALRNAALVALLTVAFVPIGAAALRTLT